MAGIPAQPALLIESSSIVSEPTLSTAIPIPIPFAFEGRAGATQAARLHPPEVENCALWPSTLQAPVAVR